MAAEQVETKLAADYEVIRRREYELITGLLDVLPKIDNLGEDRVAQVRDALFHADHPYLMVFMGPFNSGKSSMINALVGQPDLLAVSAVPTTDRITILRWGDQSQVMRSGDVDTVFHPSPLLKKVSFVDTPGLESVFQTHEETTRKFLHRADAVLLVMLATQAMTAGNLDYLRLLKDYGKNVIVVINQTDLLSLEEAESVRAYVLEQSKALLGATPDIWLVSARRGLEARGSGTLDETVWDTSGLRQLEAYVDDQLNDVARLRQKLQTPIQIIQNVNQAALAAVRANQSALDLYQNIADNIEQQLGAQKREQERIISEVIAEIDAKFDTAAERGGEAIRDIFRFSRGLSSVMRGLMELVGLAGLVRRARGGSYLGDIFARHKALEPIDELLTVSDKLAPRLEGKDIQDIDDLVRYAKREIDALPPNIRDKVIGEVKPPLNYDRAALLNVRDDLDALQKQAREVEPSRLEQALRNAILYLAAWEALVVIFGVVLLGTWDQFAQDQSQLPVILLICLLALGMAGFLIMPFRGKMLAAAYADRMAKVKTQYIEAVKKAADKQVTYSMNLRRDAVLPLTRLIEAQTTIQTTQMTRLQQAQHEMVKIEADLAALGKRSVLGIRV